MKAKAAAASAKTQKPTESPVTAPEDTSTLRELFKSYLGITLDTETDKELQQLSKILEQILETNHQDEEELTSLRTNFKS